MKITGQLKEDILTGKAVIFLGAGVSQAAGLLGARDLANYLYDKGDSPNEYEKYKGDFSRLVSKLDRNPSFSRRWVNNQIIKYFLDNTNYKNLDYHKKLLQYDWKAVFTTNYDISLELAEYYIERKKFRLLPIVNPDDKAGVINNDSSKLKYYKIHGCCRELELHPSDSPPLVITQKDFQKSISRNQPFLNELNRYAYDCSIIFIGFQAHRSENNYILGSLPDACQSFTVSFHEPFRPFAVLKDVDDETRSDLEEIDITLIEGTFEEFIDSVLSLTKEYNKNFKIPSIEEKICIKAAGIEIEITRAEYEQYTSQYTFYYEGYFDEKANKIIELEHTRIIDLWKAQPSDIFLSTGRYIKRTNYYYAINQLKNIIRGVANAKNKSPKILIIKGNRASGKTVMTKQLMQYTYTELNQPVLILSPQAHYFDKSQSATKEINVSGWDERLIDKFLSFFYDDSNESGHTTVPILLADHLSYREMALDHLLKYLENHSKPCILVLTLNTDELDDSIKRSLLQLYEYKCIQIEHRLDDEEIDNLFEKVSRDEPRIIHRKEMLIHRAKDHNECNRDILLILYMWFDRKFRRLDEIIEEEANKLNDKPDLKNLYLSISVFHQYNFTPRVFLCAKGLNISIDIFSKLRTTPPFKAFINLKNDIEEKDTELASTRHSEFSRRILNNFIPDQEKQIELMEKILKEADQSDLQFTRDFLNYIYRYEASFSLEQVIRLKEATENKLGNDSVLNHQFAAYLIRENVRLNDARYYLDISLKEDEDNQAIIHSLGNLHYTLYKNELENENISEAKEHFIAAKEYFYRSRTLIKTHDEHVYFTDIDMRKHRIEHANDDEKEKCLQNAEKQALTFEALRVVPFERQNLLRKIVGESIPFVKLPTKDQEIIVKEVMDGKASPILLEYYTESLLSRPKSKNWNKLNKIVSHYGNMNSDVATATIVCLISKKAFIKNAETRFEYLRKFYDKLVRYREIKINFILLAEYIRLLLIDALVLRKYEFLKALAFDVKELFRISLPRYLKDEYILDEKYYSFDESNKEFLIKYFENNFSDFYNINNAKRYSRLVTISSLSRDKYFYIELDPISRYFIRGIKKEIGTHNKKIEVNFCIKHTYEGFIATDFRI